jgi:hypothetical protein
LRIGIADALPFDGVLQMSRYVVHADNIGHANSLDRISFASPTTAAPIDRDQRRLRAPWLSKSGSILLNDTRATKEPTQWTRT